jgi:hypothetical protein
MNHSNANRFQDFFEESKYTLLKNYLYNYLLRKMAVEKSLQNENIKMILEVESGISPVMTRINLIIVGQSILYVACMAGCEDYAPLFVGGLVD